jgi:glycosyltransferase involved in cell wall biosynthesis
MAIFMVTNLLAKFNCMKKKVALITNAPAPYRIPVYEQVDKFKLYVLFCSRREPNRFWDITPGNLHSYIYLPENIIKRKDGYNYIHNNPSVISSLQEIRPDVVITTGFNPTHLYSYCWAKLNKVPHIYMTDGTLRSETVLGLLHKLLRHIVFFGTSSFIVASNGGRALLKSYKVQDEKIFQSHLCADNKKFETSIQYNSRKYDVMFSSQFHVRKLPHFFVEVCVEIKKKLGKCRALLIGDGPLRAEILELLKENDIDFYYGGYVNQSDLPSYYCQTKFLLFPTTLDPWGVVANEAMASGTPVITTPMAGVAGELVLDGVTGLVRDIDAAAWALSVIEVIEAPEVWSKFSRMGKSAVQGYNYTVAAQGIENACDYALGKDMSKLL